MQVLNLEAEAIQPRYRWLENNVAKPDKRHQVLKTKVIYGANAAGKSNLIMALSFFQWAVMMSASDDSFIMDKVEPFAFGETSSTEPSHFEMRMLVGGIPFRYGFTVLRGEGVVSEWLFGSPGKKEVKYFIRDGDHLELSGTHLNSVKKLQAVLEDDNALYGPRNLLLSRLASLKIKEVMSVFEDIVSLRVLNGALATNFDQHDVKRLAELDRQEKIKQLLKHAGIDLGELYVMNTLIDRKHTRVEQVTLLGDPIPGDGLALYVRPPQYEGNDILGFRADTHLSRGTIKMLLLAGTIVDTLDKGQTLIIDEFEARLHTNLSRAIVELFHDPESNPNNAQLIVATHDTNLLNPKMMRRDQIGFVDKDEDGASRIYALSDIKGVRNDASYEKDYLVGKYGGVPSVVNL